VPTRPFFLILKSVCISSRKNFCSGPWTILLETASTRKCWSGASQESTACTHGVYGVRRRRRHCRTSVCTV
jgi:hypothetical protein